MTEREEDPFEAPEISIAADEGGLRAIHRPGKIEPFRFEVDCYGAPANLSLTYDEADRLAVWLRYRLSLGR